MAHPPQPHILNKVIYYLLFLAMSNPQDVPGFHINNMGCKLIPIVELKLIYAKVPCGFLRFDELITIFGIFLF